MGDEEHINSMPIDELEAGFSRVFTHPTYI